MENPIRGSYSEMTFGIRSNTHAWPPISRHWTWCCRIEERILRIGFGIK